MRTVSVSVFVLLLAGCEKSEPIATYTVPKHESIQIAVETPAKNTTAGRMLAALILDDDVSWSFKGMGSPDDFPDDAVDRFDELIASSKFDDPAKPSWDLGEQWTELPGSGMRAANLTLGKINFSVIKLPLNTADEQQYVLDNVNRWRGQLGLPGIDAGEVDANSRNVETSDGHQATILDITGAQADSGVPPMMAGATTPEQRPARSPESTVTGKPPEDWKEATLRMSQKAAYTVESDGKTATVSVSKAGGPVFGNINRWRAQVGLSALTNESELDTQEITVSGQAGLLAEIDGEETSILIAMVPADAPTWFFKLQGPTVLVKSEAASFREYLDTIQIK